jgi:hypothetical protein
MNSLEKAGFMQISRVVTIDEYGNPTSIIEVVIDGKRYGITTEELQDAVRGKASARTFKIRSNWKQYISSLAGIAYRSKSGRALNFELLDGSKFTAALDSVLSLLYKKGRYAQIARLPVSSAMKHYQPARIVQLSQPQ